MLLLKHYEDARKNPWLYIEFLACFSFSIQMFWKTQDNIPRWVIELSCECYLDRGVHHSLSGCRMGALATSDRCHQISPLLLLSPTIIWRSCNVSLKWKIRFYGNLCKAIVSTCHPQEYVRRILNFNHFILDPLPKKMLRFLSMVNCPLPGQIRQKNNPARD